MLYWRERMYWLTLPLTLNHQKEGYQHPHISLVFIRRLIHCVGGEVWLKGDPVYRCLYVVSACSSCRVRLAHHWVELFHSCPTLLLLTAQRFIWVYSGGHVDAGNHNDQREQIIEGKMKAKYILGEMILSWSDSRARSPARRPRAGAETSSSRHLSILPVLWLKAMKRTMICFSFTKTGEHFVLFGLDCWFAFISHVKKKQNGKHDKNIFVGRKC